MFDGDKLPSASWVISSMKSGRQLAMYNFSTRFLINSWSVSCAKQLLTNGLFQILSSSSPASELEDSEDETEMLSLSLEFDGDKTGLRPTPAHASGTLSLG